MTDDLLDTVSKALLVRDILPRTDATELDYMSVKHLDWLRALVERCREAEANGYVLAMRLLQSDIVVDDTERVAMEHFIEARRKVGI